MQDQKMIERLNFKVIPGRTMSAKIMFPNGYGASVLLTEQENGRWGYDVKHYFEIAVLHGTRGHGAPICYQTRITSDVLSYLTPEELDDVLYSISLLPANALCSHAKPPLDEE